MGSKNISFHQLQIRAAALETTTSEIDLRAVFTERNHFYLNEFTLFLAHFTAIPNFSQEINVDCKRASKCFIQRYNGEIRSDRLLSDCLNIQIICSFNTDISKVDSAPMRKGRLIAKYEFKELAIEKAQKLSQKLGFPHIFNAPATLTAINNQGEKDFEQGRARGQIGFKAVGTN
ncbi:MAG: hypothetical protein WCP32_05010 [Bacteroidota bacterium]